MVDYYGLGVLTPGMGVFHLVFSYAGKVTLSVLADRDIMPDPESYHDFLVASYEELYGAAMGQGSAGESATAALKVVSPKRIPGARAKPDGASRPKAKAKAKAKAIVKTKPKAKAKPKVKAAVTPKTGTKPNTRAARPKARPKNAAQGR